MDFEQIAYEVRGTTAIVTLNRPERRNALSGKLLRELNAALKEADEYNPVHCVVLRGAGPHFCAGARRPASASASCLAATWPPSTQHSSPGRKPMTPPDRCAAAC